MILRRVDLQVLDVSSGVVEMSKFTTWRMYSWSDLRRSSTNFLPYEKRLIHLLMIVNFG